MTVTYRCFIGGLSSEGKFTHLLALQLFLVNMSDMAKIENRWRFYELQFYI